MDSKELIHRYFSGEITETEALELEERLGTDTALRREFALSAAIETGLREVAFERAVDTPTQIKHKDTKRKFRAISVFLSLAASVLILFAVSSFLFTEKSIATLTSSESASWESSLPTTPGSKLVPGVLDLKAGIATIQFDSGAQLTLEAPAVLELVTPMKGRLVKGTAVIDVPEQAIGFVIETPDGYAVDYGTQFAVRVNQLKKQSDFELIEGEIAVHHPQTGDEIRLTQQGKTATITQQSLVENDEQLEKDQEPSQLVSRVWTRRKTSSVHREGKTQYLHRDLLSVKKTKSGKNDIYSFFSFDLLDVDLKEVESARLRLNLVPSTRGYAARLPKINQFAIYGLTNQGKENWEKGCTWDEAPSPEDGELLGTFTIPRSTQRGTFGIEDESLLKFLNSNAGQRITLILVRTTTQIEGFGPGLTHTFASASHPEAVGPSLELTLRED